MMKTIVFTVQDYDVTANKAGGNVTVQLIIYLCIFYASS